NDIPRDYWNSRGVASLGINNAAAYVRTTAFVASDPPSKFHPAIFADANVWAFLPTAKRRGGRSKLRRKVGDTFEWCEYDVTQTPSTFYFERDCDFVAEEFLARESA